MKAVCGLPLTSAAVKESTVRLELCKLIKLSIITSKANPLAGAASKVKFVPENDRVSWCCNTPFKKTIALASTPGLVPML